MDLPSFHTFVQPDQLSMVKTPRIRNRFFRVSRTLDDALLEKYMLEHNILETNAKIAGFLQEFVDEESRRTHVQSRLAKQRRRSKSKVKTVMKLEKGIFNSEERMDFLKRAIEVAQADLERFLKRSEEVQEIIDLLEKIRVTIMDVLAMRLEREDSCNPLVSGDSLPEILSEDSYDDQDGEPHREPAQYHNEHLIRNLRVLYVSGGQKKNAYKVCDELKRLARKVTHKTPESDFSLESYDLIVAHRGTINHGYFYGKRHQKTKIIWIPQTLRGERVIDFVLQSLNTRKDLQFLRGVSG